MEADPSGAAKENKTGKQHKTQDALIRRIWPKSVRCMPITVLKKELSRVIQNDYRFCSVTRNKKVCSSKDYKKRNKGNKY